VSERDVSKKHTDDGQTRHGQGLSGALVADCVERVRSVLDILAGSVLGCVRASVQGRVEVDPSLAVRAFRCAVVPFAHGLCENRGCRVKWSGMSRRV